jgi:hypothetical protein
VGTGQIPIFKRRGNSPARKFRRNPGGGGKSYSQRTLRAALDFRPDLQAVEWFGTHAGTMRSKISFAKCKPALTLWPGGFSLETKFLIEPC